MKKVLRLVVVLMALMFVVGCSNSKDKETSNTISKGDDEKVTTDDVKEDTSSKDAIDVKHLNYKIENNEVIITGYLKKGKNKEVIIPETIEGYPVVEITGMAFFEDEKLESITLPSSIRKLGGYLFCSAKNLTTVNGLENVIEYGEQVFGFTKLTNATISPNIIKIEDRALMGTFGDDGHKNDIGEDIILNDTLIELGSSVFAFTTIKTITLPGSVEVIKRECVASCPNLTKAIINEGVKVIETEVFRNCPNLEEVIIPASVIEMEENIFEKTSNVTIVAPVGSVAETYATENGIAFRAQ